MGGGGVNPPPPALSNASLTGSPFDVACGDCGPACPKGQGRLRCVGVQAGDAIQGGPGVRPLGRQAPSNPMSEPLTPGPGPLRLSSANAFRP